MADETNPTVDAPVDAVETLVDVKRREAARLGADFARTGLGQRSGRRARLTARGHTGGRDGRDEQPIERP